jgi:hypothetical protein
MPPVEQGASGKPVTFIGYAERVMQLDSTKDDKIGKLVTVTSLYVTSKDSVVSYTTSSRKVSAAESKNVLSQGAGCEWQCATVADDTQSLIVGAEDAVYFFTPEVRSQFH